MEGVPPCSHDSRREREAEGVVVYTAESGQWMNHRHTESESRERRGGSFEIGVGRSSQLATGLMLSQSALTHGSSLVTPNNYETAVTTRLVLFTNEHAYYGPNHKLHLEGCLWIFSSNLSVNPPASAPPDQAYAVMECSVHLKSGLATPQEFGISGSFTDWSVANGSLLTIAGNHRTVRCQVTCHWNAGDQL